MAEFVEVPSFDIYDEDTGQWAEPENWWLDGRMIYQSDLIGEDGFPVRVVVPDRTSTDLASIPRFPPLLRHIFLKNGKHRPAAVPHDWLCRLGLEFPRRLADRVFLEAMILVGVGRIKRRLMYWAVRANTERMILIGKARKTRKPL